MPPSYMLGKYRGKGVMATNVWAWTKPKQSQKRSMQGIPN
jgi:hypothetical protein